MSKGLPMLLRLLVGATLAIPGCGAPEPGVAKYRAAAYEVLAVIRDVLPDFAAATSAIAAQHVTTSDALAQMKQVSNLQMARVVELLPHVLTAAAVISEPNATRESIITAGEALATEADNIQQLLLGDVPLIVKAMKQYVGDSNDSKLLNITASGDMGEVIEDLGELSKLVPDFFQKHLMCTSDVASVLLNLIDTAKEISFTPVDCHGPEKDELSCAGDVATSFQTLVKASEEIAAVVFDCGKVHAGCSQLLASSLSAFAAATGATMAATADCVPRASATVAFTCSLDTLQAVYSVSRATNSINWLLDTCKEEEGPMSLLRQVATTLERRLPGMLPSFLLDDVPGGHHNLIDSDDAFIAEEVDASVQRGSHYTYDDGLGYGYERRLAAGGHRRLRTKAVNATKHDVNASTRDVDGSTSSRASPIGGFDAYAGLYGLNYAKGAYDYYGYPASGSEHYFHSSGFPQGNLEVNASADDVNASVQEIKGSTPLGALTRGIPEVNASTQDVHSSAQDDDGETPLAGGKQVVAEEANASVELRTVLSGGCRSVNQRCIENGDCCSGRCSIVHLCRPAA